MIYFILNLFKSSDRKDAVDAKIQLLEVEILRLRHIVEKLEKQNSTITAMVKNQSDLIATIAGIQSDMIGTFVIDTVSPKGQKSLLGSPIGSLLVLPGEDDDIIN